MAESRGARSLLATVVGWVLVGIIVWIALGFVVGTLMWLLRMAMIVLIIGGLLTVYLRLKAPDDDA